MSIQLTEEEEKLVKKITLLYEPLLQISKEWSDINHFLFGHEKMGIEGISQRIDGIEENQKEIRVMLIEIQSTIAKIQGDNYKKYAAFVVAGGFIFAAIKWIIAFFGFLK